MKTRVIKTKISGGIEKEMSEQKQQPMPKPKILGMTDASSKTGFGGIMHNILNGVSPKYDPYLLGWGFHYEEPIKRGNYTMLPTTGNDYYGRDVLPSILSQLKPDVLLTQADTRMVGWLPEILKNIPSKPTWIYYPVIDGHVWDAENKQTKWPSNWTGFMKQADVVVAMTNFGKKILAENGIESETIYHGVDTTLFRPYTEEQREQLRTNFNFKGKFVVGGVFKNIVRKNPEKYLQAFALFRKGKEDKTILVLHTFPQPTGQGEYDLVQQAIDLGLVVGKDVIFTQQGLPTEVMPQLYNSFDAFWMLGGMESFGVPLIEAMACGVPTVALEATTFPEILGGTGLLSPAPVFPDSNKCPVTMGSYNGVEGVICDPYDIAKKTQKLYDDKQLRTNMGFKEVERAIKIFDWSVIKQQWIELLDKHVVSLEQLPDEWKEILG